MKLPPATRQSYYVLHAQFQVGNGYSPFAVMLQKSRCIVIPLPLTQSFHVLSVAGSIAQLCPKQHKMETKYSADSLLITLAGWAAT